MRVLFATSEAYPLIKTGGLADVSGSLPAALNTLGADTRILIPGYPQVLGKLKKLRRLTRLDFLPIVGSVDLLQGEMPDSDVNVIVIDHTGLYQRNGGPYQDEFGKEWPDNALRFGLLSHVAAVLSSGFSPLKWKPDIIHCNDWQTGLAPSLLHFFGTTRAKTVLGIHNLAYQGNFSPEWVSFLGLPASCFHIEGLEYYGRMSFLKAGVYYADRIITVSPTYAQEIQTTEYGCGMQGLLSSRRYLLRGILNGIDSQEWNPLTDEHLVCNYDSASLEKKQENKSALQARLGLTIDSKRPLLSVVSRMVHQKGLDLVLACASRLIMDGAQMAILGNGEPALEHGFNQLAQSFPESVSVTVGYNEKLSHQIMAGSDIFLMPSRFEPCGLNQMYGLAYGTPPVVRRTGGLADSVKDAREGSPEAKDATGFVFEHANEQEFLSCIQRAISLFHNKKAWTQLQINGMQRDLGWNRSAGEYLSAYQELAQTQ